MMKKLYIPINRLSVILLSFILTIALYGFTKYAVNTFFVLDVEISVEKQIICINETNTITFTGSGGTAPYTFRYSINGSEQTPPGQSDNNGIFSFDFNETTAGDYEIRVLSISDSDNPPTVNTVDKQYIITVKPPPTVDFSFTNDNACSGETVQFTSNATGEGPLTYLWNFGDGVTSTLQNPAHVYTSLGCGETDFGVNLIVTDRNGCTNSIAKQIKVKDKPDIEFFDTQAGNFDNCGGASDSYTISVGNSSTSTCVGDFFIDWGDGTTETTTTFPVTHTYTQIAVFDLKIRAEGDNGCSNEVSYEVKNVSNPAGGLASPGSTSNVCVIDAELTFTVTNFENNSDDTTYTIDFGDGTPTQTYTHAEITADNELTHQYLTGSCTRPNGQFIVTLNMENACGTTDATVNNIVILEPSVASFESPEISCINSSITFNNTTFIGDNPGCTKGANFRWDFGDGTIVNDVNTSTSSNQTHTYTTPGTYTTTLSVTSRCGTDTFTKTICIEPKTTADFSVNTEEGCIPLNVTTTNNVNEANLCSTPTYEWSVSYDNANCGTVSNWEFINSTNKNSKNPQFNFITSGRYTITQKVTTNCGVETISKVINVKQPPTVSINPINDICGTGTITPTATIEECTSNEGGVTYNWTFDGGTPATSTSKEPGEITYANAGDFEVTLEVTNECGVSTKATKSFEIFEKPVLTNTDLNQEICSGQATTEINLTSNVTNPDYSWIATASNGITGFIPSGNTATIPSQILINNLSTPGTLTYRVNLSKDGCDGDAVDFVITVNPAPFISTQPISSIACLNGSPTTLSVSIENGNGTPSYQWYSNTTNSNIGGTQITGATNASYDPPSNTIGDIFYYVEISFGDGGCSLLTSNPANVTIVDSVAITTPATTQNVCIGGTANPFSVSYSGGAGKVSYQWYRNTVNSNTGGNIISGATSNFYTPSTFTSIGSFYYYVTVNLDGNGCNEAISDVYTVDVVADPVVDSQPIVSQSLCANTTPTDLIVSASGGDGSALNYQWFSNTVNNTSGGSAIIGANASTYTPPSSNEGTLYYYVVVSQNTAGCSVTSDISAVTITPSPTISTQPASSEVCLNGNPTTLNVAYQNGTGTPIYQWFSNTVNSNTGGTAIAGATTSTYDPPTNTVSTTYYYAVISFTSGGCSEIVSQTAIVKVNEQITINPVAGNQTLCVGGTANEFEVTYSGGTGLPTYQWYANTVNANTGGTPINGATASTYTPPAFTTVGDYFFYAEVSLDGNGCSSATSDVYQVQVLDDPSIDKQPIANQELCQNAIPTDLSVTASGGTSSPLTYQWFVNTSNNTTNGAAISGANAPTYTPETSNIGIAYYYVIISQSESGCTVVSDISALTVNEAPVFTIQPTPSEVCLNGTATTLEAAYTNGTGTPTYQWYSNTVDDRTNGIAITGATTSTYDPPTNTVGTTYYYAVISFTSGGCSEIVSQTAIVKVNEQITINPVAGNQTLCVGGTANEFEVTYSGGTGLPTYQWYANTVNANTGGTPINGATASTYTPPAFTTVGDYFFYAEVSLDGNGCSSATSDVYQVQVLDDPSIDKQPIANQELCQNAIPTDLSVTASGGTSSPLTYQWFVNTSNNTTNGAAISGANAPTYTPETSNIGIAYYYVIISQSESGCTVVSDISALTVNEAPVFTIQPTPSEVCLNGTATTLEAAYTNGTGTPTYQWYSNTVDDRTNGIAITGATTSTYDPPTNTVGTTYYYAVISFTSGGCSEIVSQTASVKVNQIPLIDNAKITIYSEATFDFDPSIINSNTVPVGTQYTWSAPSFNPAGSILGASEATTAQSTISQTLENTGTSPIIVTYVITPATISCAGNPFTLEVTVNPNISSNTIVTNLSCFESNDGNITTNIEGGIPFSTGTPYLTSWLGPNGFSSTDASISNIEAGVYTLRIEDSTGFFITEEWIITQPELLTITREFVKNISCFQGNDGTIEVSVSGGTAAYSYNWATTNGSGIISGVKNQNSLTAGTYILEVIDKNNCITRETFILTEPEGLDITIAAKQDVLCFGEATGSVSINVSGGTKIEVSPGVFDYNYTWTGPSGYTNTTRNISDLIAGTYLVAVTDELGCTTNAEVIINESSEVKINFSKTDVSCYGAADGALELNVEGGLAPYQISWSNFANGFSQNNLEAGTYVATITDSNNCVEQIAIEINQPIFFIDPEVQLISCNGANDGSIRLNLTGGVAPISLIWDDDASAGVQRNNLAAGTYKVTIIDSDPNQCPIERSFTFTDPPAMAVTSSVSDAIDCTIENSGSIDLTVTGGTEPYIFDWSNGATTEDLQNISKGDYNVTITDANGCSVARGFSIFRQDPINIEFIESFVTNCETKTIFKQIEATVSGGFLPYTLSWSSGTVTGINNEIMTTDLNGSYVLTVTDDKGCSQTKSVLINDIPTIGDLDFRYSAFALSNYDLLSIDDPIQFENLSTGDIDEITWNFGDGSPIVKEENPIHTYEAVGNYTITLTITYKSGCTYTMQRDISITIGYQLIHPTAFTPNGDGFNETIRPKFIGFTEVEMNIYDSWGTKVYFEKGTTINGWDGTLKNKPAENGNYIMVVIGTTFYNKIIKKTTPLTLLK